jgi:hypothetical protein
MSDATYKVHGVMFLVLATGAWLLGAVVVMARSTLWGSLDLALIVVGFVAVIWAYCTKCPVRKDCSHVLPGYLTRYFPHRITGPYLRSDVAVMAAAFLAMTIFPLFWLVKNVPMLLAYVALLVIAIVDLRVKVCGQCRNVFCVLRKSPANER